GEKSDRLLHNFIEVDLFLFKRCFSQKGAHSTDDFSGAPVIKQNIFHNILQFNNVGECCDDGALRFQNCLCGFGVGQNRAERLVYFMSDGGCQFASGREAVDVSKFSHGRASLPFSKLTPTTFKYQNRDKCRLHEKKADNERDLPRITLPCRWFPEI